MVFACICLLFGNFMSKHQIQSYDILIYIITGFVLFIIAAFIANRWLIGKLYKALCKTAGDMAEITTGVLTDINEEKVSLDNYINGLKQDSYNLEKIKSHLEYWRKK